MRRILAGVVALAITALAQTNGSNLPAAIETARTAALAFADSMPDFIVTRTTTRYRGLRNQAQVMAPGTTTVLQAAIQQASNNSTTNWQTLDTVSGSIATDHGKEIYSNIVMNGKPVAMVPSSGIWSQGEFSTGLLAALSPDRAAQYTPKGRDVIRNRRANRYNFAVDQAHSDWSLPAVTSHGMSEDQRLMPAFDGTIWIDEVTGDVMRVLISAQGLPKNYPSDTIESTIDYDSVKIADVPYVLPVRSELLTCQRKGNLCFRNISVFRDYKKFEADSNLTFEK